MDDYFKFFSKHDSEVMLRKALIDFLKWDGAQEHIGMDDESIADRWIAHKRSEHELISFLYFVRTNSTCGMRPEQVLEQFRIYQFKELTK